ncbi:FbpB family small basic protein [Pseudoneobacillus sp. C159]
MNRRLSKSFSELVNKAKQEIERDPIELERIERKIDDKYTTSPKPSVKRKRII